MSITTLALMWLRRRRLAAAFRRDLDRIWCGCDLHRDCRCTTAAAS